MRYINSSDFDSQVAASQAAAKAAQKRNSVPVSARPSGVIRNEIERATEPLRRFERNLAECKAAKQPLVEKLHEVNRRLDFLANPNCGVSQSERRSAVTELIGFHFDGKDNKPVLKDGLKQKLEEKIADLDVRIVRLEAAVKNGEKTKKTVVAALQAELAQAELNENLGKHGGVAAERIENRRRMRLESDSSFDI